MKRYYYRGRCGVLPVSGHIDLDEGQPRATEAATVFLAKKAQIDSPLPLAQLQPVEIVFTENETLLEPAPVSRIGSAAAAVLAVLCL